MADWIGSGSGPAEADRSLERWRATEQKLLEESQQRIHDFERRLQYEWEALRQLHEEPLKEARARLDAIEQGASARIADAVRELREATTALREPAIPAAPAGVVTPVAASGSRPNIPLAIALIAFVLFTAYLWSRLASAEQRLAAVEGESREGRVLLQTETQAARQALQSASSEAAATSARAERMVSVMAAPDLQRFTMAGQRGAPGAGGHALWSASRGLVITASGMPRPDAGQVQQLWLVTAGGSIHLGSIVPDAQGRVMETFDVPATLASPARGFMVTVEERGSGTTPAGPVILAS